MAQTLPFSSIDAPGEDKTSPFGSDPEVKSDLEPDYRVVTSVSQGLALMETDIKDARRLIRAAAQITAKKQGDTPYSPASLRNMGAGHKSNISTRALATELKRAAPRLYMPILTASTLTAASLPPGWPLGQEKSEFFRDTLTKAFRSWKKWGSFVRGLASEAVDYGFTFACWTDPYEWKPHLVRMDRGFVPRGSEIMEENLARFTLLWEYQPDELLTLARKAVDSGVEGWNKEAVASAVQHAELPRVQNTLEKLRRFEELVREQSYDTSYEKGYKVVQTRHQFVLEGTGKVSHYIYWPDAPDNDHKLLFEHLDAYDSMDDVVIPLTFTYGDGTIHGSWGAGQLLYDMSVALEKVRNDSIDNLRQSNKMKIQVPSAKDASKVELTINSDSIIVTEGQFANNVGGISPNPEGYIALEQQMTQWMQQMVGSYLPPVPTQQSDIKAAQLYPAVLQEQEMQRDARDFWLAQFAYVIQAMSKRYLNSDGKAEKKVRKLLTEGNDQGLGLTEEEIKLLLDQPAVQSVTDFTPAEANRRASFAQSVIQNPLFKPQAAARLMALGAGGRALADYLVVPEGDNSSQAAAQREQLEELTTLIHGVDLPVVNHDSHWIHMQTMKAPAPPSPGSPGPGPSPMDAMIHAGSVKSATSLLHHYAAHYQAAVALKALPVEAINQEKSFIAQYEHALTALQQQQAQAAQQQALAAQQPPGGMPGMPGPAGQPPGPPVPLGGTPPPPPQGGPIPFPPQGPVNP